MTSLSAPGTRPQVRTARIPAAEKAARLRARAAKLRDLAATADAEAVRLEDRARPFEFRPAARYARIRGADVWLTAAGANRVRRLLNGERLRPAEVRPLADHPRFGELAEAAPDGRFELPRWIRDHLPA